MEFESTEIGYKWEKYDISTIYKWGRYNIEQVPVYEQVMGEMSGSYWGDKGSSVATDMSFSTSTGMYSLSGREVVPNLVEYGVVVAGYTNRYISPDTNNRVETSWAGTGSYSTVYYIIFTADISTNRWRAKYCTLTSRVSGYNDGKGTYVNEATSNSSGEYPDNGVYDGYWYVSTGQETTKGPFISIVISPNRDAYPDNGAQDGYWYIYQG